MYYNIIVGGDGMTKKKKLKRKDKKEIIELITATVNLIISIATLILLILKGF